MPAITASCRSRGRPHRRRRRRELHALDALGDDRLDHRREDGGGHRPPALAADERDRSRHGRREGGRWSARPPAPAASAPRPSPAGPGAPDRDADRRHDRPRCGEANALVGDPARASAGWRRPRRRADRPRSTRAIRARPPTRWRGCRPANRRGGERRGGPASPRVLRRPLRVAPRPRRAIRPDGPGRRPRRRPSRPPTRPGARPRPARPARPARRRPRRARRTAPVPGDGRRPADPGGDLTQALQRVGEIGDHLLTLVAGERSHRGQIARGLPDQRLDDGERRVLIGQHLGDLVVGRPTVGHRPDQAFQVDVVARHRRAHLVTSVTT